MSRIPALGLLAICVVLLPALPAGAKETAFNARKTTFEKMLKSKDPQARQRAFDTLRGAKEPAAIDAVIWGVKRVRADGQAIHKAQVATEKAYEDTINDLHDAQQDFETSPRSSNDLKRYNKRERKIARKRDDAIKKLKNLENDHSRNRALLDQAVLVAEEILVGFDDETLQAGLARLGQKWLASKNVDDKLRYIDTVGEIKRTQVIHNLHGIVDAEDMPNLVRGAAIKALAGQEDGGILAKAIQMLELPIDEAFLIKAAVGVLRRMHERRCIQPLMKFLERSDLKALRTEGHNALLSLTGAKIESPYAAQWKKWWEDNADKFEMPKGPKPTGIIKVAKKGVSFYGIHTFSDRILFIVDKSGSMDKQQKGKGAQGKTKWEICVQELIGAVFGLDTNGGFNVIFFNHAVMPWQNRKVPATEKIKRMLKKWVEDAEGGGEPVGGTNIFDSLEKGFMFAAFGVTGTERPPYDTIFFLTDGKPTAGKVQDSKRILEVMREWNKVAQITIHCVGIGADHDVEFMQELARIGDGQYVSR